MYFRIITKVTYSTYCMLSLWHKPTPLKLNWATGSVITDGCRAWLQFLMTQKFTNFKIRIFTLWVSVRCSCKINCADICSLNPGTCTLESMSICMPWKLKYKSQTQLHPFCLKGGVETSEYVAWDTENMFTGERQESILMFFVVLQVIAITLTRST